jgi:hypothetical protein
MDTDNDDVKVESSSSNGNGNGHAGIKTENGTKTGEGQVVADETKAVVVPSGRYTRHGKNLTSLTEVDERFKALKAAILDIEVCALECMCASVNSCVCECMDE